MHPKKEKTFVILKPDTLQRGLVGEVIKRFERIGLKIVAMKMIQADEETIFKHYNKDDAWYERKGRGIVENRKKLGKPVEKEAIEYGKDIIRTMVHYMCASPVVVMVVEGNSAQAVVKRLVGGTEPTTADTGTIRGDFALDSYFLCDTDESRGLRNLIHCTDPADGEDAYNNEVSVWFSEKEILNYRLVSEAMLYDVNLDGLTE
ncbi:MAG: nucleoside-diphosphate kinase [Candidatus Nomurabacteria bacterium]|nr:MAG: nucleoside-diphosphate kinase [Candidatus Nomurabacteria bacterium]